MTVQESSPYDPRLQQALNGEYELDFKAVIRESVEVSKNHKSGVLLALLAIFAIAVVASGLMMIGMSAFGIEADMEKQSSMLNILLTVVLAPFIAGVCIIGIKNAVSVQANAKDVFSYLGSASVLSLTALLTLVLNMVGLMFMLLPGLILSVLTSQSLALVAERGLTPIQSIHVSVVALSKQFWTLMALYAVFVVFAALLFLPSVFVVMQPKSDLHLLFATLCLMFVLTWLMPIYFNGKGIIYRQVFGLSPDHMPSDPTSQPETASDYQQEDEHPKEDQQPIADADNHNPETAEQDLNQSDADLEDKQRDSAGSDSDSNSEPSKPKGDFRG